MKKAIVIGASSGIGNELARMLAENNYRIGVTGRRTELLNELINENPTSYIVKTIDITKTTEATFYLDELIHELGGLDVLILSSGIGDINQKLEFDIERNTINTNVIGFTCIADWCFNVFRKQGFGQLVSITSIAGIRGSGSAPAYNASKAFQINYLEGLRQKAKKLKLPVTVTDIRPGFVNTDMAKGDGLFWVASPQKAAKQILYAIRKKKRVTYVTKRWAIIAMLLKILPRNIYDRL